jgi:sec-independent protein translocase protein TatA
MSIGFWQLLLVVILVFVLFGAGKLPHVIGELGKGVRSLKKSLNDRNDSEKT